MTRGCCTTGVGPRWRTLATQPVLACLQRDRLQLEAILVTPLTRTTSAGGHTADDVALSAALKQ